MFTLLSTPQSFVKGYLFAMPPDLLAMLAAVVNDLSASWKCSNGHTYFIGDLFFFLNLKKK